MEAYARIIDSSGYEYVNNIRGRLNKNHASYLNKKVTLPMMHAAVLTNIRQGGRKTPFEPITSYSKKTKKRTRVRKNTVNRQPSNLGKQQSPTPRILVHTGKLWNNLGTINRASYDRVQYGIRYADEYMRDVMEGRPARRGLITVAEHVRQGYYRKNKKTGDTVWVRGHKVRQHTKMGSLAELPRRNPLYMMPSDIKTVAKTFTDYYISGNRKKYVYIRTRLKFTANRKIRILPVKGVGRKFTQRRS